MITVLILISEAGVIQWYIIRTESYYINNENLLLTLLDCLKNTFLGKLDRHGER